MIPRSPDWILNQSGGSLPSCYFRRVALIWFDHKRPLMDWLIESERFFRISGFTYARIIFWRVIINARGVAIKWGYPATGTCVTGRAASDDSFTGVADVVGVAGVVLIVHVAKFATKFTDQKAASIQFQSFPVWFVTIKSRLSFAQLIWLQNWFNVEMTRWNCSYRILTDPIV